MIKCIIIDDEPYARELLKEYIEKSEFLKLIGEFKSPLDAMASSALHQTDLMFLDIQMPGITGIEFLKSTSHRAKVIFTTAFAEHALEGYELNVVDYLLKPFSFSRFIKAASKVMDMSILDNANTSLTHPQQAKDYLFVKDGTSLKKINYSDILYIKGMKDYVSIYTPEETITSLQNLKDLQASLPTQFYRIHNSYIISMDYVTEISRDKVKIGESFIPISQTYKHQFHEYVKKHV